MAKASTVSRAAIIGRINRRLAKKDQVLRSCQRSWRVHKTWGDYYVAKLSHPSSIPSVVAAKVNLEKLAKSVGALKPGEKIVD